MDRQSMPGGAAGRDSSASRHAPDFLEPGDFSRKAARLPGVASSNKPSRALAWLFLLLSAAFDWPAGAGAAMRDQPHYSSDPGAGETVEPFYRSYCPPDLSNYGGCPVRVYFGSYGTFWSAPPPLPVPAAPSAPARRKPAKG